MRALATLQYTSPTQRQLVVVTPDWQISFDLKSTSGEPLGRNALRTIAIMVKVASFGQIKVCDASKLVRADAPTQIDTASPKKVA